MLFTEFKNNLIRLQIKSGETISKGKLVSLDKISGKVVLGIQSDSYPIGIAYENGTSDDSIYICVSGTSNTLDILIPGENCYVNSSGDLFPESIAQVNNADYFIGVCVSTKEVRLDMKTPGSNDDETIYSNYEDSSKKWKLKGDLMSTGLREIQFQNFSESSSRIPLTNPTNTTAIEGKLTIASTEESTSKDTGSLVIEGGLGVDKNLNVGGNANIGLTLVVNGTTESVDKNSGSLIVEGGVGIEKNLNVGGNLKVTGDLEINGTQTILNTQTVQSEDSNIELNINGNSGTAQNAGITITNTDTGTPLELPALHWDEASKTWKFIGNTEFASSQDLQDHLDDPNAHTPAEVGLSNVVNFEQTINNYAGTDKIAFDYISNFLNYRIGAGSNIQLPSYLNSTGFLNGKRNFKIGDLRIMFGSSHHGNIAPAGGSVDGNGAGGDNGTVVFPENFSNIPFRPIIFLQTSSVGSISSTNDYVNLNVSGITTINAGLTATGFTFTIGEVSGNPQDIYINWVALGF